ncbi:MAG: ABC-2 transporter permease [Clostridia bacterium]|nr:ABC-2 transporter permease [Clostridia bacterium]
MNNVIRFLRRDYTAAFSSHFKYTVLLLVAFAVTLFVRSGDMIFLSILLLSYICSYFWVFAETQNQAANFLNFLPAKASEYVLAKFLFLFTAMIVFVGLALADMIIFREYMKLTMQQVINIAVCSAASCLLFGGLSFLGVFTFGAEKFKAVYGIPAFIGVILCFIAENNEIILSAIRFFTDNTANSLILLGVSAAVFIASYLISRRSFNYGVLLPTAPPARMR